MATNTHEEGPAAVLEERFGIVHHGLDDLGPVQRLHTLCVPYVLLAEIAEDVESIVRVALYCIHFLFLHFKHFFNVESLK